MTSSLFNATYYVVNQSEIEALHYPGNNYSAIPQPDGTILAPTVDAAQVGGCITRTAPDWLDGETQAEWVARNGVAVLADNADLIAGTINALILPDLVRDMAACKAMPGWVTDAPV
jgi:hypothetical protein